MMVDVDNGGCRNAVWLSVGLGLLILLTLGLGVVGLTAFLAFPATAGAQTLPDGADYAWQPVADGFEMPLLLTHAGDGSGRRFVVEQTGRVWVLAPDGSVLPQPFLDVSALLPRGVSQGGYSEQGLLGLAFHPQFAENGLVFAHYTDANGTSQLVRYNVQAANPDQVDAQSVTRVITVGQPFANHNGGHMAFAPDGLLVVGFGDGGSQDDPYRNAQNTSQLLGKLLRLDVDGTSESGAYSIPATNPFPDGNGGAPEVWAWGLRNPWRFTFDRATNDLLIGDVGGAIYEEINHVPGGDATGLNFGWPRYEANRPHLNPGPTDGLTFPVLAYDHTTGGCSVTGGHVYRGAALPALDGAYFYGDYCFGRVWVARQTDTGWDNALFHSTSYTISSFGEDEDGALYLVDYKGAIYRLAAN